MTETATHADVILPTATSPEKQGTFTNTERRIQRVRPTAEPPGEARQDWEITQELAARLGYDWGYEHPQEIMDEISDLVPIYGGITYDRLEAGDEHGLQWPCWDEDHPGTPYLYDYEEGGSTSTTVARDSCQQTADIPMNYPPRNIHSHSPPVGYSITGTPDRSPAGLKD